MVGGQFWKEHNRRMQHVNAVNYLHFKNKLKSSSEIFKVGVGRQKKLMNSILVSLDKTCVLRQSAMNWIIFSFCKFLKFLWLYNTVKHCGCTSKCVELSKFSTTNTH